MSKFEKLADRELSKQKGKSTSDSEDEDYVKLDERAFEDDKRTDRNTTAQAQEESQAGPSLYLNESQYGMLLVDLLVEYPNETEVRT